MAGPAQTAWQDALSGNMTFRGDRSKYYTLPPPSNPNNPVLSFLNKLANESLLMPQTATSGWLNAFGPPPGTAGLLPQKPPPSMGGLQMPGGPTGNLGSGPGTIAGTPVPPPRGTPMGPAAPVSMSIPLSQAQSTRDMILGLEGVARNPRSTAEGPGQFIDSTFNDFLKSTGRSLGQGGVPTDISAAKKALGAEATDWYMRENTQALAKANIPVNDATLYGSHFLGPGGLAKVWNADPNTPIAQLLDQKAISSNPEILAGKTAGEVKQWLEQKTAGTVLPSPPLVGAPPQMGMPGTLDFSQQNAYLDAAAPKGLDQASYDALHRSDVLGGLAKGAASVDATKPGSFAAALAAAGAGGSVGFSQSAGRRIEAQDKKDRQNMDYNLTRASAAGQQMTAQHANERDQLQVAYQNAKATYDTTIANNQIKYEGALKERQAQMPQVKADANGFMVQQFNPKTNTMDIQYTPTKNIMANGEKLESTMKALGAPGPVAEALLTQHVMQTIKDPTIAQATLEKEAVRRTLLNGAGSTVFGQAYASAMKAAEKEIPAAMMKDPEAYTKMQQDIAASMLYNALQRKGDRSWLKAAANNGSIIAGVLGGGAGPQ